MKLCRHLGTTILGIALIGAFGLGGCDGGEEEIGATIEWVTTPANACERGETLEASWRVVSESNIAQSVLLACAGAVADCGIAGVETISYTAEAAEADGVYTASVKIPESGVFTLVAFVSTDKGAYISPPMGVIVDQRVYPAGPYGYTASKIMQNFTLQGYRDTDADDDDDPFNEEPTEITLESFFQGQDLDARVLLLTVSAGWCPVCQDEARSLKIMYPEYKAKGGRFYTVLFQDDNYDNPSPASLDDVKAWGTTLGSHWPHAADPTDSLNPYYPEPSVPLNIYVDLTNMQIVEVHVGFDSAYTRQILNAYVD